MSKIGADELPVVATGSSPGPFVSFHGLVEPDWLDVNRHMNVSWYDYVFDKAESMLFEAIGIHERYIRDTNYSFFRLEKTVRYERELMPNVQFEVRSRVLWTDLKRVHHFHELWNLDQDHRAASAEGLSIYVDLAVRKAIKIAAPEVVDRLTSFADSHARLPWPKNATRRDFRKSA